MKIDIDLALKKLLEAKVAVNVKEPTDFWVQCVRDASGKWKKYEGQSSRYGVKYFRGYQPNIDYNNPAEVTYLRNSIAVRELFYQTILTAKDKDLAGYTLWLEELRRKLEYRPVNEWLHQRFTTTAHTIIVCEEVMRISAKYKDPYATHAATGPLFPNFSKNALPYDLQKGELIEHHYPRLQYSRSYLAASLVELRTLLDSPSDIKNYIHGVARFYQLLINLHYFAAINASLYMNMANGLIEMAGLSGIENGIVDFVALRLQPETFQQYFYDEVTAQNKLR